MIEGSSTLLAIATSVLARRCGIDEALNFGRQEQ
jgi:hypothetical protein